MDNKQYIREGQKVTFSAQLEKGDRRLTSWIVYEGNQCDDNHIVKEEKQVGTEFSHIFEKAGEYTIVSYGKRDEINKSTATKVQVGKDIFEGIECISTSISRKINNGKWEVLLDKEVKFRVKIKKQFYENLKKTGFSKLKIKIISSKNETSNAKQDKNDRTIITYNTRYLEEYSIVAEYGEEKVMAKMKVVKKFEESIAKNSSTEITTIPSGIENVRSKDSLKLNFNPKLCFIAGETEINPSNLVWKLNGNTLLAKGTQIEIPREQIANCKKNNKVEVFKNNASTKSIASYNFSVVKNEIIKFDVSETPKFGKKVTFKVKEDKKYMIFPKLEINEEIYWEVKKGSIFVARGTGLTFEHKFNEEGDFQVRCYISNVVIEEEYNNIKQPKILPNTAKWIDKDGASGNILKKAGYYQEVCAYIEHQELVGEKVSLFIYEKGTNQLIHTEKEFTIKNKKNICIPFTLEKPTVVKDVMQVYFRIKPINSELDIKNIKNQTEEYLTVVNRGDVVDAYFCDANDTKIYRAIEVGTVDLHFKLYMTNMLKKEVEILFYILWDKYPNTTPMKDCLNWVHWEMIAGHFSKKQPFHTTKAKVNNKGEILVDVPTKRLLQIKNFTRIFAVFKIMGSDGKVKGAYLESGNFLTLIPNNSLTHIEENFAPVKVLLKKVNNKVLRQEIGEESVDDAVVVLTGETVSLGKIGRERGEYYMYRVNIYNGISYETYIKNKEVLEPTDTFELARDAWKIEDKKPRSDKRYGSRNETPPGTYWLSYKPEGYGKKKHRLKVSDNPKLDEIKGVDGKREGIRIHSFSPHDAIGCLTTGAVKNPKDGSKSLEDQFIDKIPALKKKPVRFIIEPREAIEGMKTEKVKSKENPKVKVEVTNKVFKGVENKKNK